MITHIRPAAVAAALLFAVAAAACGPDAAEPREPEAVQEPPAAIQAEPAEHAPAPAALSEPFTEERFAELQREDALILVDVFANWCGTCAQQQAILAEYREANPGAPLHTLQIDFDRQKEQVRRFSAPRQSTLILYHGDERIWFSVAETNREAIFGQLDEALERAA
jgi:thioredoxin 1